MPLFAHFRGGAGRGGQDDTPVSFKTFNGIYIREPTREISAQDWDNLGWDGRACVSRLCKRGTGRGQGRVQDIGGGRGTDRAVREANVTGQEPYKEQTAGQGDGTGHGDRNGARFGGGGY